MSDLVTHLAQRIYPALFERLDQAFPEFGWRRTASGWVATNRDFTKSRLGARPDRVICHEPFGFLVHGGSPETWLAYVNGGSRPTGRDFIAAVRTLEARAGGVGCERTPPRPARSKAPRLEITSEAAVALMAVARRALSSPEGRAAREHLESRGILPNTIETFGLFTSWSEVAPKLGSAACNDLVRVRFPARDRDWRQRVLVPWHDESGRLRTFIGYRFRGDGPRYLYPPGPRPLLFGIERVASARRPIENLILVEGIFDALRLHAAGLESAAAVGGTAIRPSTVECLGSIRTLSVTLAFDADAAGQEATNAALDLFYQPGNAISVDVLDSEALKGAKDPDEFLGRYGRDGFVRALENRIPGSVLLAARLLAKSGGDRAAPAILEAVAELSARLPDTPRGRAERREFVGFVARETGRSLEHVRSLCAVARSRARNEELASATREAVQRAVTDLRDTGRAPAVVRSLRAHLEDLLVAHAPSDRTVQSRPR